MYNEDRKKAFMSMYPAHIRPKIEQSMELFSGAEERMGEDIANMTQDEREVLIRTLFRPGEDVAWVDTLIQNYVNWSNYKSTKKKTANIEPQPKYRAGKSKDRHRESFARWAREELVANSLELHWILESGLAPIESNHPDILIRCYYWLTYCGVGYKGILKITKANIDLENMVIHDFDRPRKIYNEAITTFRKAISQDYFAVFEDGEERLFKRCDSPLLLAGRTEDIDAEQFSRQNLKAAFERTGHPEKYHDISDIRDSGIFDRLYALERALKRPLTIMEFIGEDTSSHIVERSDTDERTLDVLARRAGEREKKYKYWKDAQGGSK